MRVHGGDAPAHLLQKCEFSATCHERQLSHLFLSSWSASVPACGEPLARLSECSQCSAERTALVLLEERRKKEQQTVSSIDRTHLEPGELWHVTRDQRMCCV
jgi:hypothetical protein